MKWVQIKLFFNKSSNQYYVQIGESLFIVKEKTVLVIAEKEGMEIRKGDDLKAIQIMSLEDGKTDSDTKK